MTIAVILSAHGSVSGQLLNTAEMIIGKQKNITWIDLLPEENADTLIKKFNEHLLNLNIEMGVLFLVDTWGGSPFNAAYRIISNQKNYDIITGVNIPMLIEVLMTRNTVHSIKELVHIALQSGIESIRSVQHPLSNNHHTARHKSHNHTEKKTTDVDNSVKYDNTVVHNVDRMIICVARIDDRLIHGQVVTRWAKEYKIKRIIVVNDEIAQDTIRKNLLTQVTPPGITAHVLDIDKTIRVYNNPKYARDKVIMLFTNPTDVLRLINGGVPIYSVNIGGMAFSHGKKQINNAISIDSIDIAAFTQLDKQGIDLEIRKVPSDPSLKIMKLINNIDK